MVRKLENVMTDGGTDEAREEGQLHVPVIIEDGEREIDAHAEDLEQINDVNPGVVERAVYKFDSKLAEGLQDVGCVGRIVFDKEHGSYQLYIDSEFADYGL